MTPLADDDPVRRMARLGPRRGGRRRLGNPRVEGPPRPRRRGPMNPFFAFPNPEVAT